MGLTRYLPGLLRMKKGKSQLQPDARATTQKEAMIICLFGA